MRMRKEGTKKTKTEELLEEILNDPGLWKDLLDLALVRQAESEGSASVTLDELAAGKRTYSAG